MGAPAQSHQTEVNMGNPKTGASGMEPTGSHIWWDRSSPSFLSVAFLPLHAQLRYSFLMIFNIGDHFFVECHLLVPAKILLISLPQILDDGIIQREVLFVGDRFSALRTRVRRPGVHLQKPLTDRVATWEDVWPMAFGVIWLTANDTLDGSHGF